MYPGDKLWTPYQPDQPLDLSFTTGSLAISSSSQTPSPNASPAESSAVNPEMSPSVSPAAGPSGVIPAGSSSVSRAGASGVIPAGYSGVSLAGASGVIPAEYSSVSRAGSLGVSRAGPSGVSPAGHSSLSPVLPSRVNASLVPYMVPYESHNHYSQCFAVPREQNPRTATLRRASPQLPPSLDALPLMPYEEYVKRALSEEAKSNGGSLVTNNPKMRRAVQTKRNADPNYLLQRQKNNEAAKKSRDLRKIRERTLSVRKEYLEKLLDEVMNHLCVCCKGAIRFKRPPKDENKHETCLLTRVVMNR